MPPISRPWAGVRSAIVPSSIKAPINPFRPRRLRNVDGTVDDFVRCALLAREAEWADAGIRDVRCIGDALAPGLIAHAVYAGHRYARELDAPPEGEVPFKRHFHSPRETDLRRED